MKFKVTNIKTRPALTVSWLSEDDAGSTLRGESDTTGKLLSNSNSLSDDGLTMTSIQIWATKQIYVDYISLPGVATLRLGRSIYQVTHMVSSSLSYEEIE
jgi:hypothetical protein